MRSIGEMVEVREMADFCELKLPTADDEESPHRSARRQPHTSPTACGPRPRACGPQPSRTLARHKAEPARAHENRGGGHEQSRNPTGTAYATRSRRITKRVGDRQTRMRKYAVTLTVLLVGASVAAASPAAATGGPTDGEFTDRNVVDRDPASRDIADRDPANRDIADRDPANRNTADRNVTNRAEARAPPDLPERWQETYGSGGDDTFADVVRTDDGGYLLVGWTGAEDRDGWLVKVDGAGETQWEKSLGGPNTDRLWALAETGDGYLLGGRTTTQSGPQGWLVEVGPDGAVRESRTVGEGAFYALERRDAGDADKSARYLAAGWARGDGGRDGWAVGLDADRATAWQENYSTPESYSDGYLRAVVPTDAGYYFAGKVEGDSDDAWALRVGEEGEVAWQATAGGPSRDDVWAAASASEGDSADSSADAAAGFVLAGETESDSTGPRDGWLVKFDSEGEVEWEQKPGGEGLQWLDSAMRTDEGYLFTGGSDAGPVGGVDGYVLATDAAGETRWESYYGTSGWDKPWPAIRAHDGGYLLAGQTSGGDSEGKDGWLVRIGAPNGSDAAATTGETAASSETAASDETTATAEETDTDETGDIDEASDTDETTNEAMRGETVTATADSEGGVPGFGVGAALVALAAVLLVARR